MTTHIIVTTAEPSQLRGMRGVIVEVHASYVMATVGDDPRPLRLDHGCYVTIEPEQHHGGAE